MRSGRDCFTFCFVIVAVLMFLPEANCAYLRLAFPQIAVGDTYTTVLALSNKGTTTFVGDLIVVGDDAFPLGVFINGTPSQTYNTVTVPPGGAITLTLTRPGPTVSGYLLLYDRAQNSQSIDLSADVGGTVVYQYRNGSDLLDSVGVGPAELRQHCYFNARYGDNTSVGLAIFAHGYAIDTNVTLRAKSQSGQTVSSNAFVLPSWNHKAFFINEQLSIPDGFEGTIEIDSDQYISAIALRYDGNQSSSLPLISPPNVYDFTINVGGINYQGEISLQLEDGFLGKIRWTNPPQDSPQSTNAVSLAGTGGWAGLSMFSSRLTNGTWVIVRIELNVVRPSDQLIRGTVYWMNSVGNPQGTFTATLRR